MSHSVTPSTVTRLAGLHDRMWITARGTRSTADSYILLCLETATQITIDDLARSWAVVRTRHPLLASRITGTDADPAFAYTPPRSAREASDRARAHILCYSFAPGGREDAFGALRARMADVKDDLLDMRVSNSALTWYAAAADRSAPGQYILAIRATHAVCDARSLFVTARELLALLAEPARARAELNGYFSGPGAESQQAELPGLPVAFEELYQDPTAASAEEQKEGLEAHASLLASLAYVSFYLCNMFPLSLAHRR